MPSERQKKDRPEVEGHRRRLRQRFLDSGLDGFHDYEVIELLLTLGTPRRDCKGAAKEALKQFKTFRAVMEATPRGAGEDQGHRPAEHARPASYESCVGSVFKGEAHRAGAVK